MENEQPHTRRSYMERRVKLTCYDALDDANFEGDCNSEKL